MVRDEACRRRAQVGASLFLTDCKKNKSVYDAAADQVQLTRGRLVKIVQAQNDGISVFKCDMN